MDDGKKLASTPNSTLEAAKRSISSMPQWEQKYLSTYYGTDVVSSTTPSINTKASGEKAGDCLKS